MAYLIVFVGGGIGAALRHGANRLALAWLGPDFPWGTMIVNVAGGLLMGMLAELLLIRGAGGETVRLFLATGLLGGFTTFSAFSMDAVALWQRGEHAAGAAYVAGSVILSILALMAGIAAVRAAA